MSVSDPSGSFDPIVVSAPQLEYVTPIERYRLEAGLTQQEAAKRAGVKVRTLRRAEYGETAPSFQTITALARLFGIKPVELLDETRRFYGGRRAAA